MISAGSAVPDQDAVVSGVGHTGCSLSLVRVAREEEVQGTSRAVETLAGQDDRRLLTRNEPSRRQGGSRGIPRVQDLDLKGGGLEMRALG